MQRHIVTDRPYRMVREKSTVDHLGFAAPTVLADCTKRATCQGKISVSALYRCCASIALALCIAGPTLAAQEYRLTDIGQLAAFSGTDVFDINEAGTVVGSSIVNNASRNAISFSGGTLLDLGVMQPFTSSSALSINDYGYVVGTVQNSQGLYQSRAFIQHNGIATDLGTLGGTSSEGRSINNTGQVTGSAQTIGDVSRHAFLYTNGSMVDLGALGGHTSVGTDINDAGQVAGVYYVGRNGVGAFLYSDGAMSDLSTFGAMSASGINAMGAVTGMTYGQEAYILSGSVLHSFGTLGGTQSYGSGINNRGQIVGSSYIAGDVASHAFLVNEGKMEDLNDQLEPASRSGWILTEARSVNEAGEIVGVGVFQGVRRAFLLTPVSTVPEPGRGLLALAGLAILAVSSRRSSTRKG